MILINNHLKRSILPVKCVSGELKWFACPTWRPGTKRGSLGSHFFLLAPFTGTKAKRLVEGPFPFVLWWEKHTGSCQWSKEKGQPDRGVRRGCGQYISYLTNQAEFSLSFRNGHHLQTTSVTLPLPNAKPRTHHQHSKLHSPGAVSRSALLSSVFHHEAHSGAIKGRGSNDAWPQGL